jgi:hypothetical protein
MGKLGSNPLAGLAALGLGGLATPANTGGLNPAGKQIYSLIHYWASTYLYFLSHTNIS